MKNRRALLFSLVCGLLSVTLAAFYLSSKEKYFKARYREIPILVAAKDIPRYELLEESMLLEKLIPEPFVQPAAVRADEMDRIQGYLAIATIKANEQLTHTKLGSPEEGPISMRLQKSDRACTVAVNEITGVGGLVRPWDHVDIIGIFKTVEEKSRVATHAEAVTILQNVPVLSVGRNYAPDRPENLKKDKGLFASAQNDVGFSNITVAVTPRQCMDLSLAQHVGTLTLSLRSTGNRFGGETFKGLRDERSTLSSVTGISKAIEISNRPRWLELRGEQAVFAP